MFYAAVVLGLGFYSSVLVTLTRKDTFKRNHAHIERKYGKAHREAFGEDTKINKFGYPDMGNNIFAELLPYQDWVKMNNVQRMHEAGYEYALVLLPNAFIASLCFPKITTYLLGFYALARFNHINAYTGPRGYNGAVIHEELIRFYLVCMLGTAFFSAFKLTFGIGPV